MRHAPFIARTVVACAVFAIACGMAASSTAAAQLTPVQIRALVTDNTMVIWDWRTKINRQGNRIISVRYKRQIQFRSDGSFRMKCELIRPDNSRGRCSGRRAADLRVPDKFKGYAAGTWTIRRGSLCRKGLFLKDPSHLQCWPLFRDGGRYYLIGRNPNRKRVRTPFTVRKGLRFD
jgi:hypothetical protein